MLNIAVVTSGWEGIDCVCPMRSILRLVGDDNNHDEFSGVFPDAYIVPVSLSYEKLIEGDFCNDQMVILLILSRSIHNSIIFLKIMLLL